MRKNFKSQLMLHVLEGDFHVPRSDKHDTRLDPQLWSNLPQDLLRRVLRNLPYSVKVRFRTVSKFWHSELLSEEGLRSGASTTLPSHSPVICGLEYIEDRETTGHSEILHRDRSSSCKVYELDLSFLPEECSHWCSCDFFIQEGLIGVVGGTFHEVRDCNANSPGARKSELSTLEICLLNPMTRTWRKLPTLKFEDHKEAWNVLAESQKWRIKLQVDRSSSSSGKVQFELMLLLPGSVWEDIVSVNMSVSTICTYSSLIDKWSVIECNDHHAYRSYPRALCHGFIYTLNYHQWLTTHSLLDGKLCGAYDLQTLQTAQIPTGHLRCLCQTRQFLVEYHGDVLCVQDIHTVVVGCPTFGIWKLNPASMRWSELTMVPRVVLDRFLAQIYRAKQDQYELLSVKTVGEFVCLSVYNHRMLQASETASLLVHLLVCHVPTKRWHIGFNNLVLDREQSRFELFKPCLDIFL